MTPSLSSLRLWWRLLGFAKPYRGLLALAVVAACLSAAAAAAWAWLLGPLLEAVIRGGAVTIGTVELERRAMVTILPLAVVGLAAAKATSGWLHAGLMGRAAQGALQTLRQGLYQRLLTLSPRWFEQRHTGELLSRFTTDVAAVELAVSSALSSWVKDTALVAGLLVVCALKDVRLFLLTFLVLPAMILPVTRFARAAKRAATRTQASLGALSELAAESLQNLPVVQAFGAEPAALARFDREQHRYLQAMRRSLFIRGAFTPTTEFLGIVGVALAVAVGSKAVAAEPALASHLVSFLAAALLLYQPTKALSSTASQVSASLGAASRLFEVLDARPEAEPGGQATPLARSLRFDAVRAGWGDGRDALRGVTFEVPAGRVTALVGPSGGGKSTVLSLVLGFTRPSEGTVSWDQRSLSELSRPSVRAQVAWVSQEPVLLSGTVREAVTLGRPMASEAEVWAALTRAHAASFVRALPAGLNETVGERGSRLSGGQRQRLAIARALLLQPSLLLLDEPTSSLDATTEGEVQAGLDELMKGRTTLVVAHRLSTVRRADHIIVLEHGSVVEQGTHDELLRQGGLYQSLVRAAQSGAPNATLA